MATQILTQVKLFAGQYDWSGDMNAVDVQYEAEPKDATPFGQTTRIHKGGLKTVRLNSQGFWSAGSGEVDPELFGVIGTANVATSFIPSAGAVGDVAYLFRALRAKYTPGAQVGEMLRFGTEAAGSGGHPLLRGFVLHNAAAPSTSTSTKVQVGAVAAGQSIYGALHVFSGTGTLDVVLQSDANASAGGETNRITFAQATGATSEWKSLAGAVTDEWWRLSFTIGTGPFTFAVTVGIA